MHRLEHAHVNVYLLEEAGEVTIVDAGFPATWRLVPKALSAIGRAPGDVRALVLTHAHFDHLGFARRIQHEWGVPVWMHELERYIGEHPYRYAHESPRLRYPLRYPASIPVAARMVRAGALNVPGVTGSTAIEPGMPLGVPGRPQVVFSPGHTYGHCALHLPDRDAILTGDALVTFDPYTGGSGPQVVSGAATADLDTAFAALSALDATEAATVLPGHGDPWREGIRTATAAARLAGPS